MFLKDLLVINKNWDDTSTLVIVDREVSEPRSLKLRFVRSLYGDRMVCWFKEDVVILMWVAFTLRMLLFWVSTPRQAKGSQVSWNGCSCIAPLSRQGSYSVTLWSVYRLPDWPFPSMGQPLYVGIAVSWLSLFCNSDVWWFPYPKGLLSWPGNRRSSYLVHIM